MLRDVISHARLMRESADCVQSALHSDDVKEQWIARRVYDNPAIWQQWESEHSNLMRQIADYGVRRTQIAALKQASFRLLHGKALFHYLRESDVRGDARVQIIAHFRPGRSFENALISEHSSYLRKACSYLCANHVGSDVIQDEDFLDPMQRYEELYSEYFKIYCKALTDRAGVGAQLALLPLLKHQLNEYRTAMLDPRRAQEFLRREAELRKQTGETQRLKGLKGVKGPTKGSPRART